MVDHNISSPRFPFGWNSLSWVSSSNRIWISCFLFSTEDRTTFWAGNVIIQSRWCFLVTRLSSTSCCGLNAIFTISVEDEVDVTAGQVWNYPFLDIHDEISYITISRPMYSPKKSWSIYDSDICTTSIVKWWFMHRLPVTSSAIIRRAWTFWGNLLPHSILGTLNTSERTSESPLSVINEPIAPTQLIRACIPPRQQYISLKVSSWSHEICSATL